MNLSKEIQIRGWAVLASLLFTPLMASAQTINWGNAIGDENSDSSGRAWDAGWTIQIGYFRDGFEPDRLNFSEWTRKWSTLDTAEYNAKFRYFSSSFTATRPGFEGAQVYIWIFNSKTIDPKSEWILLTDDDGAGFDDWMMPSSAGGPSGPILQWTVASASRAIMGIRSMKEKGNTSLQSESPGGIGVLASR